MGCVVVLLPNPGTTLRSRWNCKTSAIAPGTSLLVKLHPGEFYPPMDYQFDPGIFRVLIHYRGASDEAIAYFREHHADQPRADAWSGDVRSNEVTFTVPERTGQPKRTDRGEPKEGLRAAVEFQAAAGTAEATAPAGALPTKPHVATIFHVQNVSDRTITFVSETSRQGDEFIAIDEAGESQRLQGPFVTGEPIMVRWTLRPKETAELHVLTAGISQIWRPGKYTLRYGINFASLARNNGEGESDVPQPNDYQHVLYTGDTPIVIGAREMKSEPMAASGEIVGYLLDDETGEPITGGSRSGAVPSLTTRGLDEERMR